MTFKIGTKVRLSETAKQEWPHSISNPHDLQGKITNIDKCRTGWIYVKWSNGSINCYHKRDLVKCKKILLHDERGFELVFVKDKSLYVAGCRSFTYQEAIAHWGSPRYPCEIRGKEYVEAITKHHKKQEKKRVKRTKTSEVLKMISEKNQYPQFMKSIATETVVFFIKPGEGTVVCPGNNSNQIGHHCTHWCMERFVPLKGEFHLKLE